MQSSGVQLDLDSFKLKILKKTLSLDRINSQTPGPIWANFVLVNTAGFSTNRPVFLYHPVMLRITHSEL